MQKLNCVLKILLNYDELTPLTPHPGLRKSKHYIRFKENGALEFVVRPEYLHCVHT